MTTRLIAIFSIIMIGIGIFVYGQMLDLDKEQTRIKLNKSPFFTLSDPDALIGTCIGPVPFVLNAGFFDPTTYITVGSRGAGVRPSGHNITSESPTIECSPKLRLPPEGISGGTRFAFCLPADQEATLGPKNYANVAGKWPCADTLNETDRRYRFVGVQIIWPFVSPPAGHLDLRPFEPEIQESVNEYDGSIFKREGNLSLAISCRLSPYPRVDERDARWCQGKVYEHTEKLLFRIKYASPSNSKDDEAWREPVKHAIALAKQGYTAAQIQE